MNTTSVKKSATTQNGSLFEQFKDTARNELGAMGKTAASSLLGRLSSQNQGESRGAPHLASPERMPMGRRPEKKKAPEVMLFSWAERSETIQRDERIKEIKVLIKQIRDETAALEKQNKSMVAGVAKIALEQLPDNPGIYHIRFLEWVLRTIRDIRRKVSESGTWFNLLQGKRKRMGFWAKAKKHGTSFTLSGERTAATQTG